MTQDVNKDIPKLNTTTCHTNVSVLITEKYFFIHCFKTFCEEHFYIKIFSQFAKIVYE